MLGNQSVEQMEKRMGIDFPVELKEVLHKYHQAEASNIADGYWHCFDLPFVMVCGNNDLAQFVYKHLSPMNDKMTEQLQVSIVSRKKGYTEGE